MVYASMDCYVLLRITCDLSRCPCRCARVCVAVCVCRRVCTATHRLLLPAHHSMRVAVCVLQCVRAPHLAHLHVVVYARRCCAIMCALVVGYCVHGIVRLFALGVRGLLAFVCSLLCVQCVCSGGAFTVLIMFMII